MTLDLNMLNLPDYIRNYREIVQQQYTGNVKIADTSAFLVGSNPEVLVGYDPYSVSIVQNVN
jgi:hypothetical protein